MSDTTRRIQELLRSQVTPTYQLSASLQARQRGLGVRPKGFGVNAGHEQKQSGSTRAVERHQGPTDAVRKTKQKEEEQR